MTPARRLPAITAVVGLLGLPALAAAPEVAAVEPPTIDVADDTTGLPCTLAGAPIVARM